MGVLKAFVADEHAVLHVGVDVDDKLPSDIAGIDPRLTMSAEEILRPDYRLSPGEFLDRHKQGGSVAGPACRHSDSVPTEFSQSRQDLHT